jgi:hypothetical protein
MSETFSLSVKKRKWYEWLLWLVWAIVLVFVLQNAVASGGELEPRAATIFWVTTVVWLLIGGVVWFTRRGR